MGAQFPLCLQQGLKQWEERRMSQQMMGSNWCASWLMRRSEDAGGRVPTYISSFCKFLSVNIQHPLPRCLTSLRHSVWYLALLRFGCLFHLILVHTHTFLHLVCVWFVAKSLLVTESWCLLHNFSYTPCLHMWGLCSALKGCERGALQHSLYFSESLKYSLLWSFSYSCGACHPWKAYRDKCIQEEKRSKKKGFLYDWQRAVHDVPTVRLLLF